MTNDDSVIVLGIDPGYDRLGWAIGSLNHQRKPIFTKFGCIQTAKTSALTDRYLQIITELTALISEFKPTELAIETLFFAHNKTSAMKVAEARGIIIGIAVSQDLTVAEYAPSQIKSAVTGNGSATKAEVEKMVQLQTSLNLTKEIDDTIDAIAIVITHLASRRLRGIS